MLRTIGHNHHSLLNSRARDFRGAIDQRTSSNLPRTRYTEQRRRILRRGRFAAEGEIGEIFCRTGFVLAFSICIYMYISSSSYRGTNAKIFIPAVLCERLTHVLHLTMP
jgi:hypothetical protein